MQNLGSEFWWAFVLGSFGFLGLAALFLASTVSSQRKKAALEREQFRAIALREARYRSLFENAIAGFLRFRLEPGTLLEANAAALAMLRCHSKEQLAERWSAGWFAPVAGLVETLRTTEQLDQVECHVTFRDGSAAWLLLSGRITREEHTAELVLVDITREKQLQNDLFRTQRLESIGTLSGGIAHDLNGFLTPVLMYGEFIEQTAADPEIVQAARSIQRNAEYAAHLLQRLLAFARGTEFTLQPLRPPLLAVELKELIGHRLGSQITFEMLVPDHCWGIRGDSNHLLQVLTNLCVNARDAMPGGGTLTVRCRNIAPGTMPIPPPLDPQLPAILFEVEDTGIGIPPETLPRVFDPFFTTKAPGKGTGLGLALSHSIVSGHGGAITVESIPGHGSTFRVWLPAADLDADTASPEIPVERAAPRGRIVLVVEDDPEILEAVVRMLERNAFIVLQATDGEEGLQEFLDHREELSLVITDMMMPGVSGATMVRALRAIDPLLPILAISGLDAPAAIVQDATPLVQGFLRKPFTATALMNAITAVDRQRTGSNQAS